MSFVQIMKNGSVKCGKLQVCPSTTFRDFELSPQFASAKKVMHNNAWKRFQVNSEAIATSLIFYEDKLIEIHIALIDSFIKGWSEWSEESIARKKEQHDGILKQYLGDGPYQFDWGSAESIVDLKTGGSEIMVRYWPVSEMQIKQNRYK